MNDYVMGFLLGSCMVGIISGAVMTWIVDKKKKIKIEYYKIKRPKKDEIMVWNFTDNIHPKIVREFQDEISKFLKNPKEDYIFVSGIKFEVMPRKRG